jgi:hypothetical protein
VANGCERTRVENLAGEASVEPLRHPAAHREAVDYDRCITVGALSCTGWGKPEPPGRLLAVNSCNIPRLKLDFL